MGPLFSNVQHKFSQTSIPGPVFVHKKFFLDFWLIWYSTKQAYVIMICPSCIVVIRHWRRLALASALASLASVHSPPSHRIQDRNFIFSMNMHMCPQYMHIKYLVILTCSFKWQML